MPLKLLSLLNRFKTDSRGNIAVILAIAVLPIVGAIGCAVDYSLASRIRSKLQSAADAASVAAIARNSAGYNAALSMTQSGSVAAGVTDANAVFNGDVATFSGFGNLTVNSIVTKTGSTLNST